MKERITELWLLERGFKSISISGCVFKYKDKLDDYNDFIIETDGKNWFPKIGTQDCCFYEIEYTYQIERLYKAMTNNKIEKKYSFVKRKKFILPPMGSR